MGPLWTNEFEIMGYIKRIRTTLYGETARLLKEEILKRGDFKGAASEIVREALREKFKLNKLQG